MTVGELLHTMSSKELVEWQAYYSIEPFGEERADLRAGIIASTIANVNRPKGKKAYDAEDFMPKFDKYTKKNKRITPFILSTKLEKLKRILRR